jgi:protein TonB
VKTLSLKIAMHCCTSLIAGSVHAQATDSSKAIETVVAEQAMPRNGMPAFYKYLNDSMQFPQRCLELEIPSLIQLRFVVDTDGRISQVMPLQESAQCPEYTDECIRLLLASQPWLPARKDGVSVASLRTLPVSLSATGDF